MISLFLRCRCRRRPLCSLKTTTTTAARLNERTPSGETGARICQIECRLAEIRETDETPFERKNNNNLKLKTPTCRRSDHRCTMYKETKREREKVRKRERVDDRDDGDQADRIEYHHFFCG